MTIRVEKDLTQCKILWEKFCPQEILWQDWDVVLSTFDPSRYDPYFIVVSDKGKDQGILPLWFNYEVQQYRFFGEGYLENHRFLFDLVYFPEVFKSIPLITGLYEINGKNVQDILKLFPQYGEFFELADFRYFISVEKKSTMDGYLQTFSKKHRKNLLYDLRNLKELNYTLRWGGLEHFDDFVRFNVARFGDDSDYSDPVFTQEVGQFFRVLEKKGLFCSINVIINGILEGIEYGAFHKGVFYVLNGGYNSTYANLGKLLIYEMIQEGIKRGAKQIDFLVGEEDCWKKLWNCEREEYYTFRKKKELG